jgi:hypothetical protein
LEPLNFIGDHREPAPGVACHRGLYGGIQCQDIGLVGNIVDELDDIADLL